MERNDEEEGGEGLSDIYHSPRVFKLNYAEMMKFKVCIYSDGDPKTFYQIPRKLTEKYASEGYFFQNIRESRFRTFDPDQAHLFFIPISCHKMCGKVMSELESPIHVQFGKILYGKTGIICESVNTEFKKLVLMCGGPNEKLS